MAITLDGINVIDVGALIPNTSILTSKTSTAVGTGVFDVLIESTKLHLIEEYDESRITGKEYAALYLGALQAVLQQSITYILNHQQTAKLNADIALTRQKTVTELAQSDDTIPNGLGFNATPTIKGLIADQKLLNTEQIALATAQISQSEAENALIGQKIITELAQTDTDLTQAQVVSYGFNNTAVVEGLAKGQLEKINSDSDLVKQKVMTELAGTSNTVLSDYAKNTSSTIGGLSKEQIDKANAEVLLLKQKAVTELASTANYIPAGTGINTETSVSGLVGEQKMLFNAQTSGFSRDAEQKLAKIMADPLVASIAAGDISEMPSELGNASINAVISKAKAGINVS